jgi:hypothetical protein
MEASSDPLSDPFRSSPPPAVSQDLGELPNSALEPILPILSSTTAASTLEPPQLADNSSSDPLGATLQYEPLSASIHRPQSRKRPQASQGPPFSGQSRPTKGARTTTQFQPIFSTQPESRSFIHDSTQPTNSQQLVLEARDLLVRAYSTTTSRVEQGKLLDLLQIFREYTESGIIQKTSSILATQVANLEQASRKIESQARNNQSTWAKIAQIQPSSQAINQPITGQSQASATGLNQASATGPKRPKTQDWTLVTSKKGSSNGTSSNTSPITREKAYSKASGPSKLALSRRCTLLLVHQVQASSFSSIYIRDLINNAFKANGIEKPVISTVSLSIKGNIVVYTTPEFNADFLVEKKAIIKGVLPLVKDLQKGEPWYKVIIHNLPIQEFNTSDGMDLVISEITTFNKGLTPIGRPYWLTSPEARNSGLNRLGSVVVAFPIEEQANRAIKNKLFIAGISAKVVKYRTFSSSIQCKNCSSFGHLDKFCKKEPKCILCASPHIVTEHFCTICKLKGKRCIHLTPKCINCNSTSHSADSKLCEVFLALKNKANNTSTNTTTINSNTDVPTIIINE